MKDEELKKLGRILENIAEQLDEAVAAFNKYSRDPGRYKPQLENLRANLSVIQRDARGGIFVLVPGAADEYFRRISPRR